MKKHRWDCIYDRIKNIEEPVGVEVGVYKGECSSNLLRLHHGLFLHMVDLWSPDTYKNKTDAAASEIFRNIYQDNCLDNLKIAQESVELYKHRCLFFQASSVEASRKFGHTLDFAFIDAAHDYWSVKADISCWYPKIKPGGFLCGHDFENFPEVGKAVKDTFQSIATIETDDDCTWFVKL